jgi:hypothetical protein
MGAASAGRARLALRAFAWALCAIAAAATAASAGPIAGGRASTQLMAYSDESGKEHLLLQQYVRTLVRGFDNAGTVTVSGYGRISGDVQNGDDFEGRLYYLYLDKRGLFRGTDLRLGRQFFWVAAGSAIVDGARIDVRPWDFATLTAVGGRHVLFDLTGEQTRRGDYASAFQLSFDAIPDGSAALSWYRAHDESDLARDSVGFEGAKRLGKQVEAFSQLRADLITETFTEIDAGLRTTTIDGLSASAEYLRTIPEFDTTSIYATMAVEKFEYGALRAQYDWNSNLSFSGEYRREKYGDGGIGNGFEAGIRYKPWDGSQGSAFAGAVWRTGAGGDLLGFDLSGEYAWNPTLLLFGGVQHDAFQTDMMTGSRHATRFWGGFEKKIRKGLAASGRVEDTVSTDSSRDFRGRLTLNVNF